MRILIFEGIATSGKSTLIKKLSDALPPGIKIRLASEDETHVPIMKATSELHLGFFENLVHDFTQPSPDVVVIDRFYLTQAFRAKSSLQAYKQVEDMLKPFNPLTIFLKVDPSAVAERIRNAALHRDASWGAYVATKGQTIEEQAGYYIDQQKSQLALLQASSLPYVIFDTTSHDYDKITQEILAAINLKILRQK